MCVLGGETRKKGNARVQAQKNGSGEAAVLK
jgi:hypothetical protein